MHHYIRNRYICERGLEHLENEVYLTYNISTCNFLSVSNCFNQSHTWQAMLVLPPLVLKPIKANHTCGIFLLFANLQQKKEYKNKTNKTTTCGIFLPKCNLQYATCNKRCAFSNIQTRIWELPQWDHGTTTAFTQSNISSKKNCWIDQQVKIKLPTLTKCPSPLQQQTKASQYSKLAGRQISQLRVLRLQLDFNPNPKMLNYWFSFHQLQR